MCELWWKIKLWGKSIWRRRKKSTFLKTLIFTYTNHLRCQQCFQITLLFSYARRKWYNLRNLKISLLFVLRTLCFCSLGKLLILTTLVMLTPKITEVIRVTDVSEHLLCARHYPKHFTSQYYLILRTILWSRRYCCSHFIDRRLKHSKVKKWLVQFHTVSKWEKSGFKPTK